MKNITRRKTLKRIGLTFPVVSLFRSWLLPWKRRDRKVYFTNGFKVLETTKSSAILWTRVCHTEKPVSVYHERRSQIFRHPIDFDENMPIDQMDGFVLSGEGLVQFVLKSERNEVQSPWLQALQDNDFCVHFKFENLHPETHYEVEIKGKHNDTSEITTIGGSFKTFPESEKSASVVFTTSTCQYFWSFDDPERGFKTYDAMKNLDPDFFIHTGDYIYYDKPGPSAINAELARHKWKAMDSWPSLRLFFSRVPTFMIKDDHDLLRDDVHPGKTEYGELTLKEGLKIWYENVPIEGKPYRNLRYGRELEIWLVEGREFRSENDRPDGPDKTIWGTEQKQWFEKTVKASNATFKILVSATPVVGPDRDGKKDNHANVNFRNEGQWIRNLISKYPNFYVINGDRHWQYVSKDLETGIYEFGSGAVSDYHVQGWSEDDKRPEHEYLKLQGGFLSVTVQTDEKTPRITFSHHNVEGIVTHKKAFNAY